MNLRTPLLSIDPGVTGLGWAFWAEPEQPLKAGALTPRGPKIRRASWDRRARSLVDQLSHQVKGVTARGGPGQRNLLIWSECHLAIEVPEFFRDHAVGAAAAARGDIVKVALIVGMLLDRFRAFRRVELYAPREWKGQLPKPLAIERLRKILGRDHVNRLALANAKDHAWDAIGVGYHALGEGLTR